MQLATLEVKGFKSFAEKTTIHFNNRITGIVGPNGCGKSNVVDSIRWVLGEQKTSMLRLEKMENLIFNGTRSRKPAPMAEVSLTFENTRNLIPSEYKTITITRRLYRDGDSEYRLNDVPCRLKDITSLFLDTGVSADSYAIIELGMVDEILNDRDNSRRKLFEQAAGVAKYKKRKKETLDKLKSTDADLDRVKDLLFEIEANLKTLEKQAQRTRKFYELKEEYKKVSLLLARFQVQEFKGTFKSLEEQKQQAEDRKLEIETAIASAEALLEQTKAANLDKETHLFDVQKRLNGLVAVVGEKENDRNLLQTQIRYDLDKKEHAQRQIAEAGEQIERFRLSLEKLRMDAASEENVLEQRSAELKVVNAELEGVRAQHAGLRDRLSREQREFGDNERAVFEMEKKLAVLRSANESLQRDLQQSEEDHVQKRRELEEMSGKLETKEKEKLEAEAVLVGLQEQEEKRREQLAAREAELEKARMELTQETRKLDARKNEFELTKSLIENLEGFPESIKFLKKNAKWGREAPLLSDVLYTPEEYRVAIESYLEPWLNFYIVDQFQDALSAIQLLGESAKGRANFFLLNKFTESKDKPASRPGLISALDIVEVDARYRPLISSLLQHVYLTDAGTDAGEDQSVEDGIILVSKAGNFIRQHKSLGGGAVGLFEGKKIGRAKNLEKLGEEIAKLELDTYKMHQTVTAVQNAIQQLKSSSIQRELDEQRLKLGRINNDLSSVQGSKNSLLRFLESADSRSKNIAERLELNRQESETILNQLETLKSAQSGARELLDKTDSEFVAITNLLSETSSRYNQKNLEFHQQQNRVNSIRQELGFKQTQVETLETQVQRNQQIITECSASIEHNQNKLRELEHELLKGYADKEAYEQEVGDAEKNYYHSRNEIQQLEQKVRELVRSKEIASTQLEEINRQFSELKLSLTSLKERLSIEFNADLNQIIEEEFDEQLSREETEEEVAKLRKRLDNYGEINPMAVEAYDEMKTRYDFIVAQKKDLEDARDSLMNTIREIEDTAKTQFMDAFVKIRESFIRVFRTLFSEEDQCDLYLMNPEDPLESKIEIVAKPKGKRPTVIDQLSGGEKTLTATALLFSLYLLKPAPFCIFDEVDAPLDDTNISKFNRIIQEFSKESQFIIVTHNKMTMSAVDAIYGVTMPEQGVSRVVSVDFRNLN